MALTIEEYLARPMPETKWIVDQLLPVGGSLYFYGMPKVGKTLFMTGMAEAIANPAQSEFLDFKVNQHGRVLYVQIDMPPTLYHSYIKKARAEGHLSFKDFYFIDRWELPDRTLNILKPKHEAWLKAQIEMVQPLMVVLDTFRSLHTGDEDNNTLMSTVYEKMLAMLNGAALTLVHHARKPGLMSDIASEARGAVAISGKVDVIAQLSGRNTKKRKLHYLTRDTELHPDGLDLIQNPLTGLYEIKHTPATILARLQATIPNASVKQLIDGLIEAGVSKSQAYKLVNGQS